MTVTVDQLHLEFQHLVNAGDYDWKVFVLTDESRREISKVVIDPETHVVEIVAD